MINACVLLPDHFHCILTLPKTDANYAKRWRLIKLMVTKACVQELETNSRFWVFDYRCRGRTAVAVSLVE